MVSTRKASRRRQSSEMQEARRETVREIGPEPIRHRISFDVAPDIQNVLEELGQRESQPTAELVRQAVSEYVERLGYKITRIHEDVSAERVSIARSVSSAKQIVFQSKLLIRSFEDVLEYDPTRHHNSAPPELWIEDSDYLGELRRLVHELKQLNANIQNLHKRASAGEPGRLREHLHTFLDKYAGTLGTGAGVMTLGAIATLMYHLGAGEVIFDHLLKKLPGAD